MRTASTKQSRSLLSDRKYVRHDRIQIDRPRNVRDMHSLNGQCDSARQPRFAEHPIGRMAYCIAPAARNCLRSFGAAKNSASHKP